MLFFEAKEGVDFWVVNGTFESIEEDEEDAQVDDDLFVNIFDEGEQ